MHHKLITLDATQVKFDEGRKGFFSGYASVFGGIDSYGDTVLPGAYGETLKSRKRPVQMRWNHYGDVIGKWLRIEEDDKGLYVEGELTPGHSKAQDVYASLKHGAVSGMSIGYRPVKAVANDHGGVDLHEIDLVEISVVESPADLGATVDDVKSTIEQITSLKEVESLLRDAGGFSRTDAKALLACVKSLCLRDAEAERSASDIVACIKAATLKLNK